MRKTAIFNNTDSIPTWSLNPNGVFQEQALSRTTIYQSPSWVVNILRKDKKQSVYLYTVESQKYNPCFPLIQRCCRHALHMDCCVEADEGRNCSCLFSKDCNKLLGNRINSL